MQNFAEMSPDSSEEIFAVFISAKRIRHALTTPLQLMAIPHMRSDIELQSEEASMCNNALLCGGLRNYIVGEKLAC